MAPRGRRSCCFTVLLLPVLLWLGLEVATPPPLLIGAWSAMLLHSGMLLYFKQQLILAVAGSDSGSIV